MTISNKKRQRLQALEKARANVSVSNRSYEFYFDIMVAKTYKNSSF
jgi:hypothetical protein